MKLDRVLAVAALLISCVAVALAIVAFRRDPLGSTIDQYDLSSPEASLRSFNAIVQKQDLRAAWQLA